MAAVQDRAGSIDETGSISSVPDSSIDGDSDNDDMPQPAPASNPVDPVPGSSSKANEAQAERERARNRLLQRQYAQSSRTQPPSHRPLHDANIDVDDVPPPSYSEAVQRGSRPDDAVRYAWRQGITDGSLNLDSFSDLVTPTSERPPQHLRGPSGTPQHQLGIHSPAGPSSSSEDTPLPLQAGGSHQYGTMPTSVFDQNREAQSMGDEAGNEPHDSLLGTNRASKSGWFGKWTAKGKAANSLHSIGHGRSGRGGPRDERPWSETSQERRNRRLRVLAKVVIGLALLALFVRFIVWAVGKSNTGHHNDDHSHLPESGGQDPDDPEYADSPRYAHRTSLCKNARYWTRYNSYNFNLGDDLRIFEALDYSRTTGTIRIVPAPHDQHYNISVNLAMTASDDWSIDAVHFTIDRSGEHVRTFTVDDPRLYSGPGLFGPCLDIDIVMSVKPEVELNNLLLHTTHLQVLIDDGVFANSTVAKGLHVANMTQIKTTSGKVYSSYLSSRETVIETASGDISGSFSLYDLLSIHSHSGTIDIKVDPKEAAKDDPSHVAFLTLGTNSGSITAKAPTAGDLPNRLYQTNVRTDSSSISGSYIFGPNANFETSSGSINADLLPYLFHQTAGGRKSAPTNTVTSTTSTTSPTPSASSSPSVPATPAIPDIPEIPKIPKIPSIPTYGTADIHFPSRPEIPGIPTVPKIPSIPHIPSLPRPHIPSAPEILPPDHNLVDRDGGGSNTILALSSRTRSSSTDFRILSPYVPRILSRAAGSAAGNFTLKSAHSSMSGHVSLRYPAEWSGTLTAASTSGAIHVTGARLRRVGVSQEEETEEGEGEERAVWGKKEVWERSRDGDDGDGVGDSVAKIDTISGGIDVGFGL